jgi:hypothetical protein
MDNHGGALTATTTTSSGVEEGGPGSATLRACLASAQDMAKDVEGLKQDIFKAWQVRCSCMPAYLGASWSVSHCMLLYHQSGRHIPTTAVG